MIELIGIIGGLLFAAGCVPLARATWKAGKDLGTPLSTQWLLFLACILYSVFLIGAFGANHVAFWFLVVEVVSWGIVLWFHYFPREEIIEITTKLVDTNFRPCAPQCWAECYDHNSGVGVCSAKVPMPFVQAGPTLTYNRDTTLPKDPGYMQRLRGLDS